MTSYKKHLCEPWFSLMKLKLKTVEGRLNKSDFAMMNVGDFIIFTNEDLGFYREFKIKIKQISYYDTFESYLKYESLEKCLPGINNMEDGLHVYYSFYTKSAESQYKVKAFSFYTEELF